MASKRKKIPKQEARAIELMEGVLSGRMKISMPVPTKKAAMPNRIGGGTPAGEQEFLATSYIRLLRVLLPGILASLSDLGDPRSQSKTKHSLPCLMLYGILLFLSHTPSRRAANREIGGSPLTELMSEFVPGVGAMPHADTLERLLRGLDTGALEMKYESLLKEFIKSPEFRGINPGRFLIAVDGTQKFSRDWRWDSRAQSRNAGDPDKERYFAYAVESVLIMENGIVVPLLTEFLENSETLDGSGKQDCETNAFKRLAGRLLKLFGKGCATIVLDGLYPTGPVISLCKSYGWEFMITLKRDSLKSVWEDFDGLRKIEHGNCLHSQYGHRGQEYHWSNDIEYIYGKNNKRLSLNLVTCKETWEEGQAKKKPVQKTATFAWLSSSRLAQGNVAALCVLARKRWRIENHFHVLKHQGYGYKHCFTYDWNAMKGYHVLTKIANFLNSLILHNREMLTYVAGEGKKGCIKKVWCILKTSKVSDCCPEPAQIPASKDRIKINFSKLKLMAA